MDIKLTFTSSLCKRFCHNMNRFPCFWERIPAHLFLKVGHLLSLFIFAVMYLIVKSKKYLPREPADNIFILMNIL